MPPAKKTTAHDDSSSSSKPTNTTGSRGKKAQNSTQASGSALKESVTAEDGSAQGQSSSIDWNAESLPLLEHYRHAHKMDISPAFQSPLNQALLTNPGIGRRSPTMVRKRQDRRVPKSQLALAVRKNFNSAAVNEVNVAVDLLYKIRHQDKAFRMRSHPSKSRSG